MVRWFYILGISSLLVSCGIFGLCVRQWHQADPQHEALLQAPSAVEQFRDSAGQCAGEGAERTPPLVAQAEILASYLAPPRLCSGQEGQTTAGLVSPPEASELALPVRPAAGTVNFKLRGTSYYPDQPGRSMALIAEPGVVDGQERRVKEGTQLGHFVIHEIRRGMIVYRDGEQLREMAVEHGASAPSLVRDVRSGSLQVSAAVGDVEATLPASAAPNDMSCWLFAGYLCDPQCTLR
jgi:hypothetical protein